MTAISSVINLHCIAISTDSFITGYNVITKENKIIVKQKTKIVKIGKLLERS